VSITPHFRYAEPLKIMALSDGLVGGEWGNMDQKRVCPLYWEMNIFYDVHRSKVLFLRTCKI
jgi:hypothetical protein